MARKNKSKDRALHLFAYMKNYAQFIIQKSHVFEEVQLQDVIEKVEKKLTEIFSDPIVEQPKELAEVNAESLNFSNWCQNSYEKTE